MRPALLALAALLPSAGASGGCGHDADGGEGRLLRALGDDADLIVVAAPRHATGTWVERVATLVVPTVPACVRERARVADAVAVTWAQRDGRDGAWSLALIGGAATAAGCPALTRGDGLAWYGADPRAGGHRFFASDERKRRWRALGDAPLRALGDVELQPGIRVRATATVDPRDGVAAAVSLRFDERAAADGLAQRLTRWRGRLDRARLGGAWPALAVELTRDPRDPRGATLSGALRLPGVAGDEAMVFAVTALRGGELATPGAPCPTIGDAWAATVHCAGGGRFVVTRALRAQLVAEPSLLVRDVRVVPAVKDGVSAGFKLYAIRPASLVAALGFQNGDRIHAIGGTATTLGDVGEALARLATQDDVTIELERRGQTLALRYEVR